MSRFPLTPWLLTLAGLVPFVGLAIVYVNAEKLHFFAANALIVYGAIILSFLGGTRWGAEIARKGEKGGDPGVLVMAMAPSIVGWLAVLSPLQAGHWHGWAAGVLIAGLLLTALWDLLDIRRGAWPDWYGPLRITATLGAACSLLALYSR